MEANYFGQATDSPRALGTDFDLFNKLFANISQIKPFAPDNTYFDSNQQINFDSKPIEIPKFEIEKIPDFRDIDLHLDEITEPKPYHYSSGFDTSTFLTILVILVVVKFVFLAIYYIAYYCRQKKPSIIVYETLVVTPRSDYLPSNNAAAEANNGGCQPANDLPPTYNDAVKPNNIKLQSHVVEEV